MSQENLAQFRQLVLQDTALQQQLRETSDQQSFINLMLQLGQAGGYAFAAAEVEAALQAARRDWLERWIQ